MSNLKDHSAAATRAIDCARSLVYYTRLMPCHVLAVQRNKRNRWKNPIKTPLCSRPTAVHGLGTCYHPLHGSPSLFVNVSCKVRVLLCPASRAQAARHSLAWTPGHAYQQPRGMLCVDELRRRCSYTSALTPAAACACCVVCAQRQLEMCVNKEGRAAALKKWKYRPSTPLRPTPAGLQLPLPATYDYTLRYCSL